jgi:PleD family two-component response regulator
MANGPVAIVVGASDEEFAHVDQCLADWECVSASLRDEEMAVSSISETARLIVVYARNDQKNTLALCEQLRGSPGNSVAPILLVISRYELPQGNAVERMGNATFIIVPFGERDFRERISELFKDS